MATLLRLQFGFLKAGFESNWGRSLRMRKREALPVPNLLAQFRGTILTQTHLPGLSSLSMLVDIVIHQMDIPPTTRNITVIFPIGGYPVARDLWTKIASFLAGNCFRLSAVD